MRVKLDGRIRYQTLTEAYGLRLTANGITVGARIRKYYKVGSISKIVGSAWTCCPVGHPVTRHRMSLSYITALCKFFQTESLSISKGEDLVKSGNVTSCTLVDGILKGTVYVHLRRKSYTAEIELGRNMEIVRAGCECSGARVAKCPHVAALYIYIIRKELTGDNVPADSEDVIYTTANDSMKPPSYGSTVDETQTKRPVSEGDNPSAVTHKKFPELENEEEDQEEDMTCKEVYPPIVNKSDLMQQIEKLQKEQEEIRYKQQEHEQHIQELLDREPSVSQSFQTWRNSLVTHKNSSQFREFKNVSAVSVISKQPKLPPWSDQHIYAQIEQLYANFHVLHFPSKTAQSILDGSKMSNNFFEEATKNEIQSLRNKVKELEEKLLKKQGAAPTPHPPKPPPRIVAEKLTAEPLFVPGRPTSPTPPALSDLSPIEVTFRWVISNYSKKLREEKLAEGNRVISPAFYLTSHGYRAQIEAYLNGNGSGTNKCMSVFLRIIQGSHDKDLKWPVSLHVVVILVNQSGDQTDSLKSDDNLFHYKKPLGRSDSDGETDCWGLVEFVNHDMIKQRKYISRDQIELKCRIRFM